ncbi:MAG TPA: NAD(P)/FAD-dependent oxidoreductase [Bacteroidales bacterium]|nr:NAD(P)/FAD-dependent oxidoreductase [Bacteroidales bacterium]
MVKKITIIGGGMAGLSAGIYARMNGFEAEIIEMHSTAGGQCTAWDRKGYRFDYCLHWLVGTRTGPFNDIWKETNVINENVEIIDHEISSKIRTDDGKEFIFYTNLEKWKNYLLKIAPEDSKGINKMCNDMRKSRFLSPFTDPPGLRNFFQMIKLGLSMLPVLILFLKYGSKTCKDYFHSLNLKNHDLLFFLDSLYGSRDFSALGFIMMFAWFNKKNAGYLVGGSRPLVQRMSEKFTNLGGRLTTGRKVARILTENDITKGVSLSDGTEIYSDYVISAADGHSTIFEMLEGRYINRKILNAYENWELFTPLVQVSFGINKQISSDVPAELWLNRDMLIGMTKTQNGYSIMNYCFDPEMAPKGKTTMVIRFDSPWELWKDMTPVEYKYEKEKIAKDCTEILLKHYPEISGNIEAIDVATPLTDVKYTGVWKGAYEGFMPSGKTMMKNFSPILPGLKKFYMAGQWLFPGGGLPPAAQSGKWAIQYICKDEGIRFKTC